MNCGVADCLLTAGYVIIIFSVCIIFRPLGCNVSLECFTTKNLKNLDFFPFQIRQGSLFLENCFIGGNESNRDNEPQVK